MYRRITKILKKRGFVIIFIYNYTRRSDHFDTFLGRDTTFTRHLKRVSGDARFWEIEQC